MSDAYDRLRGLALNAVRMGMPEPPPAHPGVSGLLAEIPAEGGFVAIVAMGDGSTSMYTSNGGGVVGAGQHRAVAETTHALLALVGTRLGDLPESADEDRPGPGLVRLFVMTPDGGRRVADVPEPAF